MRQCLSVLLAWMLSMNSLPGEPRSLATLHYPQTPGVQKANLKERALAVPTGSLVEVRLKTKEKLRGQLIEVSDEAITLKVAKGEKINERKLAFDELTSIKRIEGGQVRSRLQFDLVESSGAKKLPVIVMFGAHGCLGVGVVQD